MGDRGKLKNYQDKTDTQLCFCTCTLVGCTWGTRHTFSLMAFLCLLVNQLVRINLPIALVAMVKTKNQEDSSLIGTECPFPANWNHDNASVTHLNVSRFHILAPF